MKAPPRIFNFFDNLPQSLPEEAVDTILNTGAVRVERIVSRGHRSPADGWYDQQSGEIVVLLRGSAALRFEGREGLLVMRPGDCIDIPAHSRHQVAWTDSETDTVWLTVHYQPPENAEGA